MLRDIWVDLSFHTQSPVASASSSVNWKLYHFRIFAFFFFFFFGLRVKHIKCLACVKRRSFLSQGNR